MTTNLFDALGDLAPKTTDESLGIAPDAEPVLSLSDQFFNLTSNNDFTNAEAIRQQTLTNANDNIRGDAIRSWGDVVTDTGTSIARGTSNMAAGIASLTALVDYQNILGFSAAKAGEYFGLDGLTQFGNSLQEPTGEYIAAIADTNDKVQTATQSWFSDPTDIAISKTQQQIANAETANADSGEYANAVTEELANLWDTTKAYIDNPLAAGDLAIQQVPQLLAGGVVGKAATKLSSARLAAAQALQGEEKLAAIIAANKARSTLAGRLQLTSIVGQEAGGAANATATQVLKTDFTALEKNSPAYNEYISQGIAPEQARELLAVRAGSLASLIQAPIAFATGSLVAKFESNPLGNMGTSFGTKVMEAAKNVGKEIIEEVPQSAGGQLAQNIAVLNTSDNTQEISKGVGRAGAEGLVGAALSTGAIQSPAIASGLVPDAVKAASSAAYTIGKTGLAVPAAIIDYVAKKRSTSSADSKNVDEVTQNVKRNFDETANEAASVYSQVRSEQPKGSTEPISDTTNTDGITPNSNDTVTKSNGNNAVNNIFSNEGLETVSNIANSTDANAVKLVNAVRALDSVPETSTEQRRALGIYAADLYGELQNEFASNQQQIENGTGNTELLQKQNNVIATLLQNERSINLVRQIDEMRVSDAEWEAVTKTLLDVSPENINSPEVQKAFLTIKNKSVDTPTDVLPEQYTYVLKHDTSLNPEQRKVLEAKRDVSQAIVDSSKVRNNIRMQSRAQFKSINEYTNKFFTSLRNNLPNNAAQELSDLRRFAEAAQSRAIAHDEVATRLIPISDKHTNEMTAVPNFYQLDENGKYPVDSEGNISPNAKNQFVNVKSENGLRNLQMIQDDANAVTRAFNAIATRYPEFNLAPIEEYQPTWQNLKPSTDNKTIGDSVKPENTVTTELATEQVNEPANSVTEVTPEDIDIARRSMGGMNGIVGTKVRDLIGRIWASKAAIGIGNNTQTFNEIYTEEFSKVEPIVQDAFLNIIKQVQDFRVKNNLKADTQTNEDTNVTTEATVNEPKSTNEESTTKAVTTEEVATQEETETETPTTNVGERTAGKTSRGIDDGVSTVDSDNVVAVPNAFSELLPNTDALSTATTAAEISARTNQLIKSFNISGSKTNLTPNFVEDVILAYEESPEDVEALIDPNAQFTDVQRNGVTRYLANVKNIANVMNERLQKFANENKVIETFTKDNGSRPAWALGSNKALYATVIDGNKIAYQNDLLNALTLSGFNWLLSDGRDLSGLSNSQLADLLGIYETELNTDLRNQVIAAGVPIGRVIEQIANKFEQYAGLSLNKNASRTYGKTISKALAQELLATLRDKNIITVTPFKGDTSNKNADYTVYNFVKINEKRVESLREDLGNQVDIADKLILKERQSKVHIGKPPATIAEKVNGKTLQLVPPKVKKSIEVQQNNAYYLNTDYVNLIDGLTDEDNSQFAASGYQSVDGQAFNKAHLASIEGKNTGILSSAFALDNHIADLNNYAEINGLNLDEVPTYFEFGMDSNGRQRITAPHNPQASKYWREAISSAKVDIDLNNESEVNELFLHLAQGLGIKVDKKSNQKAIDEVKGTIFNELPELGDNPTESEIATFNAEYTRQAAINTLMVGLTDGFDTWSNEDRLTVVKEVQGKGEKYQHALLQIAKFLIALENGETTLSHYMTFEVDGVTDGPANSIVMMTMNHVNPLIMNTLQKIGWLVNRPNTTSNQIYNELPDLYTSVSENISNKLNMIKGSSEGGNLRSLMRLMHFANLADIKTDTKTDSKLLGLTRAFAKAGVTPATYGAGITSMSQTFVKEYVNAFYSHLSDVLGGGQLNQSFVKALANQITNPKTRNELNQIAQGNFEVMANFEIPSVDYEDMTKAFMDSLGEVIYEAINEETHGSLENNKKIAKLAQVQAIFYKEAYVKAYKDKHAEMVAANLLAPNEMLSTNQEDEILNSLQNIAPIYSNGITGSVKSNGMYMAQLNRNSPNPINTASLPLIKRARSSALDGTLESNANMTEIGLPGVRTVPLLVISSGDASMMTNYFNDNPNLKAQNVYDGLDTIIGNMENSSNAINSAVEQGWAEDTLLRLVQSYNDTSNQGNFVNSIDTLSPTALADLKRTLGLDLNVKTPTVISALSNLQSTLEVQAKRNKAVRMALLEVKSNISHMGGVDTPYVTGSTEYAGSQKDVAKAIQERANEIYATFAPNYVKEHDANLVKAIARNSQSVNGNQIVEAKALRNILLSQKFGDDKYRQFLAKRLAFGLPSNIKLVFGDHNSINELQSKLFPNVAPMLETETGRQLGNYIFLTEASPEVLLHEVIHSELANYVTSYFSKGSNLNPDRISAIKALDGLMEEFLDNGFRTEFSQIADLNDVALMKAQVINAMRSGDRATALNEFVAWSLSNSGINRVAARTETTNPNLKVSDSKFLRLFAKVRNWIAKLLGIPMSKDFQSVLETMTGQFDAAIFATDSNGTNGNSESVSQLSEYLSHDNDSEFSNTLTGIVKVLDENFIKPVLNPAERPNYSVNAEIGFNNTYDNVLAATDWFQAQGFIMNEQERHAFQLMQSFFKSGAQLNTTALNQMNKLFEYIIPQLSVEDFMVNPNSTEQTDIDAAQRIYDAIVKPSEFKEHQLANFTALAISNGHLQRVLRKKQLPKAKWLGTGSIDAKLNNFGNQLIDTLATTFINGGSKTNVIEQVNKLAQQIATINDSSKSSMLSKLEAPLRIADNIVAKQISRIGQAAMDKVSARIAEGKDVTNLDIVKNLGLTIAGLGSKNSQAFEALQTIVNSTNVWRPLTQLVNEMIGTNESNARIMRLLQQAKNQVSAVRQEIKREVPKVLKSKFSRKLKLEEHIALRKVLGESDIQILGSAFTLDDLRDILSNKGRLTAEIAAFKQDIADFPYGDMYLKHSENLAHFLVTKDSRSHHLLRNAYAIAMLPGIGVQVGDIKPYVETISQYVTLLALDRMSDSDKDIVSTLINDEREGVQFMFNYLRELAKIERSKQNNYNRLNSYKGYIPESFSGNRKLVVVDAQRGLELVQKYGYTYLGSANSKSNNTLGYYFTSQNLTATYTQGAIQNVEPLIAGVDPLSGRSKDLKGSYILNNETIIESRRILAQANARNPITNSGSNLMPIFSQNGDIVAYEAPIPEALRQQHLTPDNDFYGQIATWHARATEETLAHTFNNEVAKALATMWQRAHGLDKASFVNIAESAKNNQVDKRTWNSLPVSVKTQLRNAFGDSPIMIRRDVLDNALGYSNFNIASVFTGETDLPKPVQSGIKQLAVALLGKNALRHLLAVERGQQEVVSLTKDWVVVRSVIVGVRNIQSNFLQLKMHNVDTTKLFSGQLGKLKEVDDFIKNRKEITDLQLENLGNPSEDNLLKIQRLTEANERMSIIPLIRAGELPTVAEGMTVEDDEAIRHGLGGYIDKLYDKLPKGISKALQYATLAKNTPINSAMNRMLTYSDFVAKAVLFDKLTLEDGYTTEAALQFLQDEFVNYDNNPGRTRSYMEAMGLTWFTNYKLKIQKVNLRLLRDHPLAALTVQGTAGQLGLATPLDANMITGSNQHIFGTPLKALEIPSLHPVVQLLN